MFWAAALWLLGVPVASAATPGFVRYADLNGVPYTVTYDKQSFFINGERTIFLSGWFHCGLFKLLKIMSVHLLAPCRLHPLRALHARHVGRFVYEGCQ
jgi:hypothetical protein